MLVAIYNLCTVACWMTNVVKPTIITDSWYHRAIFYPISVQYYGSLTNDFTYTPASWWVYDFRVSILRLLNKLKLVVLPPRCFVCWNFVRLAAFIKSWPIPVLRFLLPRLTTRLAAFLRVNCCSILPMLWFLHPRLTLIYNRGHTPTSWWVYNLRVSILKLLNLLYCTDASYTGTLSVLQHFSGLGQSQFFGSCSHILPHVSPCIFPSTSIFPRFLTVARYLCINPCTHISPSSTVMDIGVQSRHPLVYC